MADFPDIEPDLEEIALIANNQVYNSPLTGQAQTAGLTGAKWQCTPTFSNRNGKEARDLRAFLFNQEGVSGRFNYYPASIDNIGTHAGGGVVDGAGQTGKSLSTKGWDADQPLLFSAGDYLTINGEMKMVTADVAAPQSYIEYTSTNYMPSPFDPSGWNSSANSGITEVSIQNPSGSSVLGLVDSTALAGVSILNSTLDKTALAGEKVYIGFMFKDITGDFRLIMQIKIDGAIKNSIINPDGSIFAQTTDVQIKIDDLGDGFFLIQCEHELISESSDIDAFIYFNNNNEGIQFYSQAAFFGKANDWPAKLRASATIPIAPALRVSPSDENAIEVERPYFPARLDTDDMSRLQVSAPVIYNASLSIVEDF